MPPTEQVSPPEVLMVVTKPDGGKAIITETIPNGDGSWSVCVAGQLRVWPLGDGYSVDA